MKLTKNNHHIEAGNFVNSPRSRTFLLSFFFKVLISSLLLIGCQPFQTTTNDQDSSYEEDDSTNLDANTPNNNDSYSNSVVNIDVGLDVKNLKFVGDFEIIKIYASMSDGSIQDVTSQVQWLVTPNYIGNMVLTEPVRFEAESQGQGEITASLGSKSVTIPMTVINNSITALTIETGGITIGQQTNLQAFALFEDGSKVDISNEADWASTDNEMVIITQNPTFITPTLLGDTLITASYEGYTGSQFISVTEPRIMSLEMVPHDQTRPGNGVIQIGKTGQMRIVATFTDGTTHDYTEYARWYSNSPKLEISSSYGTRGQIKGIRPGPTEVTASVGDRFLKSDMLVSSGCVSIKLLPDPNNNAHIEAFKSVDLELKIECKFSNGEILDVTDLATFTFDYPEADILVVDEKLIFRPYEMTTTPLSGVVDIPGISLPFTAEIKDKPVRSIEITSVPVDLKCNTNTSHQLVALGTYGDGAAAEVRDITNIVKWTSSNPSFLTVGDTKGVDKGQIVTYAPGKIINVKVDYTGIDGVSFEINQEIGIGKSELLDIELRLYKNLPGGEPILADGPIYLPEGRSESWKVWATRGCGDEVDYTNLTGSMVFEKDDETTIEFSNKTIYSSLNEGIRPVKLTFTEDSEVFIAEPKYIEHAKREVAQFKIDTGDTIKDETIRGNDSQINNWIEVGSQSYFTAEAQFTNYDRFRPFENIQDITTAAALPDGENIHTTTINWSTDDPSIASIEQSTGVVQGITEGAVLVDASIELEYTDTSRPNLTISIRPSDQILLGVRTPCEEGPGVARFSYYCYKYGQTGESCTETCGEGLVNTKGLEAIDTLLKCQELLRVLLRKSDLGAIDANTGGLGLGCANETQAFLDETTSPNGSLPGVSRVCACNP